MYVCVCERLYLLLYFRHFEQYVPSLKRFNLAFENDIVFVICVCSSSAVVVVVVLFSSIPPVIVLWLNMGLEFYGQFGAKQ